MYRYRVGVRNLGGSLGSFGSSGQNMLVFLLIEIFLNMIQMDIRDI